jgi:hypothetical protein
MHTPRGALGGETIRRAAVRCERLAEGDELRRAASLVGSCHRDAKLDFYV